MKYNAPFDQPSNPNAGYVDGNPYTGTQGSIVPAASIEFDQREIVQAILDIALATPSNTDLTQLSAAIRFMRPQFVADAGSVNHVSVTLNPAPHAWAIPLCFFVEMGFTSTTTSPDCAIAGISGTKSIKKRDGSSLSIGDLVVGTIALFVYDGNYVRVLTPVPSELGGHVSGGAVAGSGLINVQVFTVSGTYYPTSGATKALIISTGGGASGAVFCGIGGAGGGAGATALALLSLVGVTSKPVVIGAGASGSSIDHTIGANGGDTYVGAPGSYVAYAGGGLGATGSAGSSAMNGGLGGTATGGLMLIAGGDGFGPASSDPQPGSGGSSFWGGGARCPGGASTTGAAGRAYGAGGAGGMDTASGSGANGVTVFLEF